MSAHASWVAARAREVRSAAADAYDAEFEVARVVAECVDDVAVAAEHNDALDLNEALADARLELEVVSSERDALRRRLLEEGVLRTRCGASTGFGDIVVRKTDRTLRQRPGR